MVDADLASALSGRVCMHEGGHISRGGLAGPCSM